MVGMIPPDLSSHQECLSDTQFLIRSGHDVRFTSGGYREADADACTWAHELVPKGFSLWNIASVPWHR
jgi:hypothetical protein